MPTLTHRPGAGLTARLAEWLGYSPTISSTCDDIAELADHHQRLTELGCLRDLDADEANELERIEAAITDLVAFLPNHAGGPFTVSFHTSYGTVRIATPDGMEVLP